MKRVHASKACDPCIRRKMRCNAATPGDNCPNCVRLNKHCTWEKKRLPRGPPRKTKDVESPEKPAIPQPRATSSNGAESSVGSIAGPSDAADMAMNVYPTTSYSTDTPLDCLAAVSHFSNIEEELPAVPSLPFIDSPWPELTSLSAVSSFMDWVWFDNPAQMAADRFDDFAPVSTTSLLLSSPCAPSHDVTTTVGHLLDEAALLSRVHHYCHSHHCVQFIVDEMDIANRIAKDDHYTDQRFLAHLYSMAAFCELFEQFGSVLEPRPGAAREYAAIAQTNMILVGSTSNYSVQDIATCLNLHFVWGGLLDKQSGWYWLQQALSIAQALGVDAFNLFLPQAESTLRLKTYYVLVIMERAVSLYPPSLVFTAPQSLRLPGNIWERTTKWRDSLPAHVLADFPLRHMRLIGLLTPEVFGCWRDRCSDGGKRCTSWTAESAVRLQKMLAHELATALSSDKTHEYLKLTISAFWLQDRLWNICRTHGLVKHDHVIPELSLDLIIVNLVRCSEYCTSIPNKELFKPFDLGVKISDLVMTATTILHSKEPGLAGSNRPVLGMTFGPIIDRFIGLLRSVNHDAIAMSLVKAVAEVVDTK